MFCQKCGCQLNDNAKFCTKCGAKVESASASQKEDTKTGQGDVKQSKKKSPILFLLILLGLIVVVGVGVISFVKQKKTPEDNEITAEFSMEETVMEEEESTTAAAVETTEVETMTTEVPTEAETLARPSVSLMYSVDMNFTGLRKVNIQKENTTQSSHVVQQGTSNDNTAWSAFDGRPETSWQEGAGGDGIGENLSANFGRVCNIKALTLMLGNHRSDSWYKKNNRPRVLSVCLGSEEYEVEFPDQMKEFALELSSPIAASSISLIIRDVYKGTEYEDTIIAEIGVYEE